MALGFVLVSTAPNREQEVYENLLRVPEITDLHPLFGEFDIIAKIHAADFDALGHAIVTQIRAIDGITATKTLTGTSL